MSLAASSEGTMAKDAFDYEIESNRPDAARDEARAERILLRVLAGVALVLGAGAGAWLLMVALGR